MPRKIIAFIICFCLIFEQAGFAQVAPQLGVPAYLSSIPLAADNFRPVHLRSISLDPEANSVNVLLDKGNARKFQKQEIKDTTKKLMEYFQTGLRLPNSMFWVNLRPDAPKDIIDPYLENTDLGQVLLSADLQLKKDLAKFTDPSTAEGKQYWDKLYAKAESLLGSGDIEIPTITRPWIVPGEIIIGEAKNSAYIYKATLKVMLEQDYLKDAVQYSFDDERMQQMNAYSSQLVRELIIPKLTRHVNASKQYAPLRQVFYSLILAQWFKARNAGASGMYSDQIDTRDLSGLASQTAWSKDTYFKAYQKSFKDGEYNKDESVYSYNGMSVRRYFSGGLQLAITNVLNKGVGVLAMAVPPQQISKEMIHVKVGSAVEVIGIPQDDKVPAQQEDSRKVDASFPDQSVFQINISPMLEEITRIAEADGLKIAFAGGSARRMVLGGDQNNGYSDVDLLIRTSVVSDQELSMDTISKLKAFREKIEEKFNIHVDIINLKDSVLESQYSMMINKAATLDRLSIYREKGKWMITDETGGSYQDDIRNGRLRLTDKGRIDYRTVLRFVRQIGERPQALDDQLTQDALEEISTFVLSAKAGNDEYLSNFTVDYIIQSTIKGNRNTLDRALSFNVTDFLKMYLHAKNPQQINQILRKIGNNEKSLYDVLSAMADLDKIAEIVVSNRKTGKHMDLSDFDDAFPKVMRDNPLAKKYDMAAFKDFVFQLVPEKLRTDRLKLQLDRFVEKEMVGYLKSVNSHDMAWRMVNNSYIDAVIQYQLLKDKPILEDYSRLATIVTPIFFKHATENADNINKAIRDKKFYNMLDYYCREYSPSTPQADGGISGIKTRIILALAEIGIVINKTGTIAYLKKASLAKSNSLQMRKDSMHAIELISLLSSNSTAIRYLAQKALVDIILYAPELGVSDFTLLLALTPIAANVEPLFYDQFNQADIDALFEIYKANQDNVELMCPIADIIANALVCFPERLSLSRQMIRNADDVIFDDGRPIENLDSYISLKRRFREKNISAKYFDFVTIFKDGAYSREMKSLATALDKGIVSQGNIQDILWILGWAHASEYDASSRKLDILDQAIQFVQDETEMGRLASMIRRASVEYSHRDSMQQEIIEAFRIFFQHFPREHRNNAMDLLEAIIVNCPRGASAVLMYAGQELFCPDKYGENTFFLINELLIQLAGQAKGKTLDVYREMELILSLWLRLNPVDRQASFIKKLSALLSHISNIAPDQKKDFVRYVALVLSKKGNITEADFDEVSSQILKMFFADVDMAQRFGIFFKLLETTYFTSSEFIEPSLSSVLSINPSAGIPVLARLCAVEQKSREQNNASKRNILFQETMIAALNKINEDELAKALETDIMLVRLYKKMPAQFQWIWKMEGSSGLASDLINILRSDKRFDEGFSLLLLQRVFEKHDVAVVAEFIRKEKPGAYLLFQYIYNSPLTGSDFRKRLLKDAPVSFIAKLMKINIKLAQYVKDKTDTLFFEEMLMQLDKHKDIYNEIAYNLNREMTLDPSERRLGEDEKIRLFDLLFALKDRESLKRAKEMFDEYFWNDPDANPISVTELEELLGYVPIGEIDRLIELIKENPKESIEEVINEVKRETTNEFVLRRVEWILSNLFAIQNRIEKIKPLARQIAANGKDTKELVALIHMVSTVMSLTELRKIAIDKGADLFDVLAFRLEMATQEEKEKLISKYILDIDKLQDDSQKEDIFDELSVQFDCQPVQSKVRIYMRVLLMSAKDFNRAYEIFNKLQKNEDINENTQKQWFAFKFLAAKRACIENNEPLIRFFHDANSQSDATLKLNIVEGIRNLYISRKTTGPVAVLAKQIQLPERKSKLPHVYYELLLLIYSTELLKGPLSPYSASIFKLLQGHISGINTSPELRRTTATLKNELYDKIGLFSRIPHREMVFSRIVEITAKKSISSGTESERIAAFHKELIKNLENYAKVVDAYYATWGKEGWTPANGDEQQMADLSRNIFDKLSHDDEIVQSDIDVLLGLLSKHEAGILISQFATHVEMDGKNEELIEQLNKYMQNPQAQRTDHKGKKILGLITFYLQTIAGGREDAGARKTIETKQIYQNIFNALLAETQGKFKAWRYAGEGYRTTIDEIIRHEVARLSDAEQKTFWAQADKAPAGTLYDKLQAIQGFAVIKESVDRIKKGWEQDLSYSIQIDIKGQQRNMGVVFTDDFNSLFNSGNRDLYNYGGATSCQSCAYPHDLNRGLTGYVVNGRNKIVAILDENGHVVTRRIVRLALLEDSAGVRSQAIFVEESMQFGKIGIENLYGVLDILSKQTGLPVVVSDHRAADIDELKNGDKQTFKIFLPYDRSELDYSDAYGYYVEPGHISAGLYSLAHPENKERGPVAVGVTVDIPGLMLVRPANVLSNDQIEKKYGLLASGGTITERSTSNEKQDGGVGVEEKKDDDSADGQSQADSAEEKETTGSELINAAKQEINGSRLKTLLNAWKDDQLLTTLDSYSENTFGLSGSLGSQGSKWDPVIEMIMEEATNVFYEKGIYNVNVSRSIDPSLIYFVERPVIDNTRTVGMAPVAVGDSRQSIVVGIQETNAMTLQVLIHEVVHVLSVANDAGGGLRFKYGESDLGIKLDEGFTDLLAIDIAEAVQRRLWDAELSQLDLNPQQQELMKDLGSDWNYIPEFMVFRIGYPMQIAAIRSISEAFEARGIDFRRELMEAKLLGYSDYLDTLVKNCGVRATEELLKGDFSLVIESLEVASQADGGKTPEELGAEFDQIMSKIRKRFIATMMDPREERTLKSMEIVEVSLIDDGPEDGKVYRISCASKDNFLAFADKDKKIIALAIDTRLGNSFFIANNQDEWPSEDYLFLPESVFSIFQDKLGLFKQENIADKRLEFGSIKVTDAFRGKVFLPLINHYYGIEQLRSSFISNPIIRNLIRKVGGDVVVSYSGKAKLMVGKFYKGVSAYAQGGDTWYDLFKYRMMKDFELSYLVIIAHEFAHERFDQMSADIKERDAKARVLSYFLSERASLGEIIKSHLLYEKHEGDRVVTEMIAYIVENLAHGNLTVAMNGQEENIKDSDIDILINNGFLPSDFSPTTSDKDRFAKNNHKIDYDYLIRVYPPAQERKDKLERALSGEVRYGTRKDGGMLKQLLESIPVQERLKFIEMARNSRGVADKEGSSIVFEFTLPGGQKISTPPVVFRNGSLQIGNQSFSATGTPYDPENEPNNVKRMGEQYLKRKESNSTYIYENFISSIDEHLKYLMKSHLGNDYPAIRQRVKLKMENLSFEFAFAIINDDAGVPRVVRLPADYRIAINLQIGGFGESVITRAHTDGHFHPPVPPEMRSSDIPSIADLENMMIKYAKAAGQDILHIIETEVAREVFLTGYTVKYDKLPELEAAVKRVDDRGLAGVELEEAIKTEILAKEKGYFVIEKFKVDDQGNILAKDGGITNVEPKDGALHITGRPGIEAQGDEVLLARVRTVDYAIAHYDNLVLIDSYDPSIENNDEMIKDLTKLAVRVLIPKIRQKDYWREVLRNKTEDKKISESSLVVLDNRRVYFVKSGVLTSFELDADRKEDMGTAIKKYFYRPVMETSGRDRGAADRISEAGAVFYALAKEADAKANGIQTRFNDFGGQNDGGGPSEASNGDTSTKADEINAPGGIDLRSLPITTRPLADATVAAGSRTLVAPADSATLKTLQDTWSKIRSQMQQGPMPYKEIKEYVACCKEKGATEQIDIMFACIANILRMEEDRAVETPQELKEILITIG
jgi:hypothetical protein